MFDYTITPPLIPVSSFFISDGNFATDGRLILSIISLNAVLEEIGKLYKMDEPVKSMLHCERVRDQGLSLFRLLGHLPLQLSSGKPTMMADDELAPKGLYICAPLLKHITVDTNSVLEQQSGILD